MKHFIIKMRPKMVEAIQRIFETYTKRELSDASTWLAYLFCDSPHTPLHCRARLLKIQSILHLQPHMQ